jgi:hypothetical protein
MRRQFFGTLIAEDIMATTNPDRDLRGGKDANPDPITGAPGAHPVGVGVGAAGAGAAGAAIGAVGGPVGAAVGAVVGAVAGGLAGKGVAESVNPTEEDAYWRENYKGRDYADDRNIDYDRDLAPAYRAGYTAAPQYHGRAFDEVESDLGRNWDKTKGQSRLSWERAKAATRDAYHRASDKLERATPGDADRDGK